MYELEKHRRYDSYTQPDTFETIKQSDNREELETIARDYKLTVGKTFYEKLVINEWDNDGNIIDVETIKQA